MERDILTATKTPWLVRLLYAFQDLDFVYLAMEYVPGGDFRTLLNNAAGSILPMWNVLFYLSEMFTGVNELHKLGYIHRDLKPEVSLCTVHQQLRTDIYVVQNFLMDGTGHVKLTDFGLATGALNPQRIESMKVKVRVLQHLPRLTTDSTRSLTRRRTTRSLVAQHSNGGPCTARCAKPTHASGYLLSDPPITWRQKFSKASHTRIQSTTGL